MIRTVRKQDLPALLTIEAQAAPKSRYGIQELAGLLVRFKQTFLVVEEEGAVVGYIVFYPGGHLISLAVAASRRRRGVGSALVREAARRCAPAPLWLEVRETNRAARSFYRSLGFAQRDVNRGYYPNGEDALILQR